jgi:multimeric flavodoxin WrbA
MRILGILGSPRESGNTAALLEELCAAATRRGHSAQIVNVARMDIRGCAACGACKTGAVDRCAIDDDMRALYPKLVEADALVLASPVIMAHVSAQMKSFLDRWYAFLDAAHEVRLIGGKKAVVIVTSGAPGFVFGRKAAKWARYLLRYFKLDVVDLLVAGGLGSSSVREKPALLERARRIGEAL